MSEQKRILVLDGGGVKGVAQAVALDWIEYKTGKPIHELFDLIVGSSVGAIGAAVMAAGLVPAKKYMEMMQATIPCLFKRAWCPRVPLYTRKPFAEAWRLMGLDGIYYSEVKTNCMITAMSYLDNCTHFFKSWHANEQNFPLYDVQLRSWAAPYYFGSVTDEAGVWADGGCGLANCPLGHAITQAVRCGWLWNKPTHILSLGTGFNRETRTRKKAKKMKTLGQLGAFLNLDDGGWARYESAHQAVKNAEGMLGMIPGYTFQRVDVEIPAKLDKLDKASELPYYLRMGRQMASQIAWEKLKD